MISIGSSLFLPAVAGPHPAGAEDRRPASPSTIAATSRVQQGSIGDERSGQPDPRVLQPVPSDGTADADKPRSESEKAAVAPNRRPDDRSPDHGTTPRLLHPREPVPPLTRFAGIPTETTAEIQRLREEARSDASDSSGGPPGAALRIGSSVSTLRQIQTTETPTLDIHR